MRSARIAAAAACSLALPVLAAGAIGITHAAGQSAAQPMAAGHRGTPVIVIRPGMIHAAGARRAPESTAYCERQYQIACYSPGQIEQAYQLPALFKKGITGAGQTIVIVDSYGSPTVRRDLTVFDKAAKLAAPPSLKIIQPAGKVARYRQNNNREGWAGETELDVEYAHAFAPGAKIVLVETPTAENEGTTGFPQIVRAEKYVLAHQLAGVISQSFSASEKSFASRSAVLKLRGAYVEAQQDGVTVLAASGDTGAADVHFNGSTYYLHPVTSWPDSDPLVTGVGGTQLHLRAAGRPRAATVWNDTYNVPTQNYINGDSGPNPLAGGGGKSAIFARPSYQKSVAAVVGGRRGVPDISMSGACNGAGDMYQSFPGEPAGWYPTCGTSQSTPEFAGIVALADQVAGHPIGLINPYLYRLAAQHAPGLVDVTRGGNSVSFRQGGKFHTVHGFLARHGYDLAAGLGTIDARLFVPELGLMARHPDWSWPRIAASIASRTW